jgi:aminoglycoside phosphotransferase (APT) family kinase protein
VEIPYQGSSRAYARALLGDDVAGAVREVVDAESCFYVSASASLVLGLVRRDGSHVALKVLPTERRSLEQVEAVVEVQRALSASGFPAPKPVAGPRLLGGGVATVEEWVQGEQADLHAPPLRRRAARLLAELVALAPRLETLPGGLSRIAGRVFPPPHHPRFDFGRPEGAWIDEAAAAAKPALETERDVVGHADWSTKNMGWRDGRVVAVFDWSDSCVLEAEATIVGQASVFFPATWDEPFGPKHAGLEEMRAFVAEYTDAAGRSLDPEAVGAAQIYVAAYAARCELSDLDGAEGDFQRALRQLL